MVVDEECWQIRVAIVGQEARKHTPTKNVIDYVAQ